MVIYFESDVVTPPAKIFMGKDKFENEELIRWGWPEDVWFHVDKVSSAHVYLRLKVEQTLDDIPQQVIEDCAQLVKANSIQGNKMNNIKVVYTLWANLKKTQGMDVGQVGFHDQKAVRLITVDKRIPEVVKRLEKTRVEKEDVDFRKERELRDKKESEDRKKALKEEQERLKDEQLKREEESKLRSYADIFVPEKMTSTNKDGGNDSDDFM